MRAFSSKHALTEGVIEVEGTIVTGSPGTKYFKQSGHRYTQPLLTVGKDAHLTRDAAVEAAEFLRERKLASLRRQIAKIEELDFSKEAGK